MQTLFWLSVILLGFAFAGYPVLMIFLARSKSPSNASQTQSASLPFLSFVLVAANEQQRIKQRVLNLLAAQYPSDRLEVIIVSDGSTDATNQIIADLSQSDSRIKLVALPERKGKANGLNQGVSAARGEIIVFADARQEFPAETVGLLVNAFMNPKLGAISGRLLMGGGESAVGQGVRSYWSLESRLREAEAIIDSCVGCTGAVYAIRRSLYQPIPEDTLLDDVVIPMQIAAQGYRVGYEPKALAYDPQDLDPDREKIRKRRTLAGNFQMLFRYPSWLVPGKNRIWFQLIAHKYLRLLGPLLLLAILISSLALREMPFYQVCFCGQIVLYSLGIVGLFMPRVRAKLLSLPAGFLFLNWMIIAGFLHYLRNPASGAWEMTRRN